MVPRSRTPAFGSRQRPSTGGEAITTDDKTTARAWRDILALARAEGLTTYDAPYLELAIRRGAPLVTKDAAVTAAAGRCGVATAS
jgi:predicted nucleic acid-binding protein